MSETAINAATALMLPEMARAELALRNAAAAIGIRYTVAPFGALRTEADTAKILGYRKTDYARYVAALKRTNPSATPIPVTRWRPIAQFGNSWHNYGAAIDLNVTTRPVGMSAAAALARLGALAPAHGLRWGGTFKRVDSPHFELALSLPEVRRRWLAVHPAAGVRKGSANGGALMVLALAGVALLVLAKS